MVPYSIISILLFSTVISDDLMLVQTVFRHGDRAPLGTYPTDPRQESFWPVQWGQLTTTGMRQHFEQGRKLKDMYTNYNNFMTDEYKNYNIYVRSTDIDRTLLSAYSHLAGFFLKSNNTHPTDQLWPNNWSPVPVHTVGFESDHLLSTDAHCPRQAQLHLARKNAPVFQAFMAQQRPLLETISKYAGLNVTDYTYYAPFNLFYDTTVIEKSYNLSVPLWITDNLWEQFENGISLEEDYFYGSDHFGSGVDNEILFLRSGTLLKQIIDNMNDAVLRKNDIKYYIYSTHDTTVGALLRSLQAKEDVLGIQRPDMAATIVLELWRKSDARYYVRVLYIRNSESDPQVITHYIDGCNAQEFCLLDDFITSSQPFICDDVIQACQVK